MSAKNLCVTYRAGFCILTKKMKGTIRFMAKVGKNIRTQRIKQGMSQETLAEKLFVSRQTVSNYETGKSYPDIDMLVKIAEELNVEVQVLIYGEAVKKKPPVFDKRYLITDIVVSVLLYFITWIIVRCRQISLDVSPFENQMWNMGFAFGILILHIFVHWLIGVYEKRDLLKEEIIYAGLSNILEFVLAIFILNNLRFITELFYFPRYYIALFFGLLIIVEACITMIRYRKRYLPKDNKSV